jgi:hypothetical protein
MPTSTACPKCSHPLEFCQEPLNLSTVQPSLGICGAAYCPECNEITINGGRCPLDKPDCPVISA